MTGSLVAFLRDRLNDDEQGVDFLHHINCGAFRDEQSTGVFRDEDCDCGWPARVLADVAAKRATFNHLANLAAACPEDDWPDDGNMCAAPVADQARYILRLLAQPYADHPQFREEWKT